MSNEEIPFKEKLKSIQFSGQRTKPRVEVHDDKKHVELLDENGQYAGHEVHHKSGRQDAVGMLEAPPPVEIKI